MKTDKNANDLELSKKDKEFSVICEVSMELSRLLDFDEVLIKAVGLMAELLHPDGVQIYLWDKKDHELRLKAHRGLSQEFLEQIERVIIGDGYFRAALESKKPFGVNISEFPDNTGRIFFEKEGIKSLLVIPLIFKDHISGILNITSTRTYDFFGDKLDFLSALGDQISIAIENKSRLIHDDLTGLYNRCYIIDEIRREIQKSIRYQYPLSLMMLDLDFFKKVNDKYGHLVGDLVLKQFSDCIASKLRKIDVFGRYGGEEFAVITPHTNLSGAVELGERLLKTVSEYVFGPQGTSFYMTTSIGIATLDGDVKTEDDLIALADRSLYLAKEQGRNCVRVVQA